MAAASIERLISQSSTYLRLLIKYRWPTAVATLSLTLLFTVIIAKIPNVYEATTTILVNAQHVSEKYVSPAVNSELYARLNTISQQVLSRTELQEIMNKFNLYAERRGSSSLEELIERMRDDITVQAKQGSGPESSTFTITYKGRNPALVAQVANELATSFIHWNLSSREQQVTGTQNFLSSELERARQNLEHQEENLKKFKMQHLGETPDQVSTNVQALTALRSALDANADALNRLEQEKVLLSHPDPTAPPTPGANPNVPVPLTERERLELERNQLEATRQRLREHYSDRYPDVVRATRRIEELNAQLASLPAAPIVQGPNSKSEENVVPVARVRVELIETEMKRRQNEQDRLQSQIATYQSKIDAAPLREAQLVELTRNYEVSKQHYQTLLDGTFNIGMAADLEQKQATERFTVLDFAQTPQKPIQPKRKQLIPLGALVALGLSIFGVIVKDTQNPAVKSEMELKSLLPAGVRVWGFIPRIEVAVDTRRARRSAIYASIACILLGAAVFVVILANRPL